MGEERDREMRVSGIEQIEKEQRVWNNTKLMDEQVEEETCKSICSLDNLSLFTNIVKFIRFIEGYLVLFIGD